MKKASLFRIASALILLASSCSKNEIYTGSGNLLSETRDITTFNKVSSEGVITLTITQGDVPSLKVTADDNIIDRVISKVVNNELRLYLADGNYREIHIDINLVVPELSQIRNYGAGNVTISNLNLTGDLLLENEGSTAIEMSGSANTLTITNEGSGPVEAFEFIARNTFIDIIGSGDCKVYCTKTLKANIEGSGDVYYKGNPIIDFTVSGSGRVIDAN